MTKNGYGHVAIKEKDLARLMELKDGVSVFKVDQELIPSTIEDTGVPGCTILRLYHFIFSGKNLPQSVQGKAQDIHLSYVRYDLEHLSDMPLMQRLYICIKIIFKRLVKI